MVSLGELQKRHKEWEDKNFPNPDFVDSLQNGLLGMMEELGELAHSELKKKQGIRGTEAEHLLALRDAIGDVTVYAMGVANRMHWDLDRCMELGGQRISQYDESATVTEVALRTWHVGGTLVNSLLNNFELMGKKRMGLVLIGLKDIASRYGWNYLQIVNEVSDKVFNRDWISDPTAGGEKEFTSAGDVDPL